MDLNYRSQRLLLAFGAICVFASFVSCNFANAFEGREDQPIAQVVEKAKPVIDDAKTENVNYPATPEGVIEDFIKNNHSVTAMKQYYLNCEGIDCEGEVTQNERFMGLFDYDLDPCTTEGLKRMTVRIMNSCKVSKTKINGDRAEVKVNYNMKGILKIACIPEPYIFFGPQKNWKGIATYKLMKKENKWKIVNIFIDIQPPLPKSEKWSINKINNIKSYYSNNNRLENEFNVCIDGIKTNKKCIITVHKK